MKYQQIGFLQILKKVPFHEANEVWNLFCNFILFSGYKQRLIKCTIIQELPHNKFRDDSIHSTPT